jgi:RND family efflux transporter MFP subunit
MKRYGILAAAVLAAAGMALNGCADRESVAKGERGDAVAATRLGASDAARATTADLAAGVPISGPLQPVFEIKLTSPFDDVVETVLVREGQAVRRGQALARFRTTVVEPGAASAEARRRIAATNYERMKNLAAAGAVSQSDVENAEAAARAAEAEAAQAHKQLQDATVKAPISGVVSRRVVESGDRVGSGDPLFEVVDTSELELLASVPSEYVGRVRVGSPVRLDVTGYEGRSVEGRVARINATADPATRQVQVYVRVANRDHKLVGGLFASGRLLTGEARGALAVPTAAVRSAGEGSEVWVVEDGKLAIRKVVTGVRDEQKDLVEIRSGLRAGDVVVTGPLEGLRAGQPITLNGKER